MWLLFHFLIKKMRFWYNEKYSNLDVGLYCLNKTLWRDAGETGFLYCLLHISEHSVRVWNKLCGFTMNPHMDSFKPGNIHMKRGLLCIFLNALKPLLMKTGICSVSTGGGLVKKWGFVDLTQAGRSLQEDLHRSRGRNAVCFKQIRNLLGMWSTYLSSQPCVVLLGWNILHFMDHCP